MKRTRPVRLEAVERVDQISRVTLEAFARGCGLRDRQHRPLSNFPLGRVEVLIIS